MRYVTVVGLSALLACGQPGTPVPVVGTATDLTQLAGRWIGDFSSVETGRSGGVGNAVSHRAGADDGDVFHGASKTAARLSRCSNTRSGRKIASPEIGSWP